MVTVTHGDRVVYPADGWTKADVVEHYGRVAEAMLPQLASRPLTLVRHRASIDDKGFFQKNTPEHFPAFIRRIVRWDELDEVAPNQHTIATVAARLEQPDPLLELARRPVDAKALCARAEALRDELALELVRYDRFGRPMPVE